MFLIVIHKLLLICRFYSFRISYRVTCAVIGLLARSDDTTRGFNNECLKSSLANFRKNSDWSITV